MWIVFIGKEKHSAWFSRFEATHQKKVLEVHGYKKVTITCDNTVNCENGHYYI
jgi:hypothetical protein